MRSGFRLGVECVTAIVVVLTIVPGLIKWLFADPPVPEVIPPTIGAQPLNKDVKRRKQRQTPGEQDRPNVTRSLSDVT